LAGQGVGLVCDAALVLAKTDDAAV
jgi:hypothetical protein